MIQTAIVAALTGASPLPSDGATAMADDFARLCLSQATAFPGTVALARAAGWSNESISDLLGEVPRMRETIFFSPTEPERILAVGFKTSYTKSPHLACSISRVGADFAEAADATAARLGRAPTKRDDANSIAVWTATHGTRRTIAVGKGIGGVSTGTSILAIDFLEEKAAP